MNNKGTDEDGIIRNKDSDDDINNDSDVLDSDKDMVSARRTVADPFHDDSDNHRDIKDADAGAEEGSNSSSSSCSNHNY
jgi:hypothetical protein